MVKHLNVKVSLDFSLNERVYGLAMQIDTIKINDDNKRGFKIINKSDFNEKLHSVYGEGKPKKTVSKEKAKKASNDDN